MNKILKKILVSILISVLVILITSTFIFTNLFQTWHLKLANSLYTEGNPSEEIVILAIDEKSISSQVGLGRFHNWRRSYYADVIDKLNEAGAKAIGVDLLLSEKSEDIPQEEIDSLILKSKIRTSENKNEIFYEKFNEYFSDNDHPDDFELKESMKPNVVLAGTVVFSMKDNAFAFNIDNPAEAIMPLSILVDSYFDQMGIANIHVDDDGIVRKFPLQFIDENDGEYSSFSLQVAQKYTDNKIDASNIPLEQGNMLINYFGGAYSYNYMSFRDIYFDNYNFPDIKDKIVLIGATTPQAANDQFIVPVSEEVFMPGVEVHANAIQTILDGKFLLNQSKLSQVITVAGVSLAGTLVVSFLPIWIGILAAILLVIGYTGTAHIAFKKGLILNMVYPYFAIALSYFGGVIFKYFAELKDKTFIKTTFGKYLSPNVMKQVLGNPDKLHLGGTKKEITVFFSDIANFTSMSEKLSPEELVSFVNEYLSVMTKMITDFEGTLDKYIGDAIVAYFGAPIDQEDHAIRCCKTALYMRAAIQKLHEKWEKEGKPLIDFRIGINTGQAIVGNVGSEKRFDYTIMGDEVNLGSRLEGVNKKYGTHILISESTKNQLGDLFVTREVDLIKVKGKETPVLVHELLAEKEGLSDEGSKLLMLYGEGMNLYKKRNFKDAHLAFKKVLGIYPEDSLSKLYIERSDMLSNYPPQDDWDGVFEMKSK